MDNNTSKDFSGLPRGAELQPEDIDLDEIDWEQEARDDAESLAAEKLIATVGPKAYRKMQPMDLLGLSDTNK